MRGKKYIFEKDNQLNLITMISEPKDIVTTCPKCGNYSFKLHMGAHHGAGASTQGHCSKCHYQATVRYQNDSFASKIISIG